MRTRLATSVALFVSRALSQTDAQAWPPAAVQNNTFNGTYPELPSAYQILSGAGVPQQQAEAVLVALEFERSNWAGSSTRLDPFYQDVPSHDGLPAGSVLKVESVTNGSLYTLPPGVSLSRFLFTTETLNGTVVPASAFVLWPYLAKSFDGLTSCGNSPNGTSVKKPMPVIGWGHGTSGWSGECGPSHIRNLWYQFSAPYTMALQGYAVVAPDFAGLGLDRDFEGNFVAHQYGANPASGGDILFAIEAAQKAWSERLSREFVVMGHSQGGGAAWGAAEQLAKRPVDGYRGTVAASPLTSLLDNANFAQEYAPTVLGEGLARFSTAMKSVFPEFEKSEWLTEEGVNLTEANQELQGCQSVALELIAGFNLSRSDWSDTWYLPAFDALTRSGGKEFAGPMLVLQGVADNAVPEVLVSATVNETCEAVPEAQLEFALLDGVGHVPVLYAGQQVWLDWIADRFKGAEVTRGCKQTLHEPQLETSVFQGDFQFTLQYVEYAYETA
ncbi:secretory lipase [Xylariaceae sp. FL1019]|nr:secretory lipase [Xylariaceae sp. FL1019]